jgi:hypothetical protein
MLQNLKVLLWRHVAEQDLLLEPACKTRVHREQIVHLLIITGKNHNQLRSEALVCEDADQFIHCLLCEMTFRQTICFVNEEDPAKSTFEELAGLWTSLSHILADKIRRRTFNDFIGAEHIHVVVHTAHLAGCGGLAGACGVNQMRISVLYK